MKMERYIATPYTIGALTPYEKIAMPDSRSLRSSWGDWNLTWEGMGLEVLTNYGAPYYILAVATALTASYWIYRTMLAFDTSDLPEDIIIHNAHISLYVLNHEATFRPSANIIVTPGVFRIPVIIADWAMQTPLIGIGGQKLCATFVNSAFNDIELNDQGLGWINPGGITEFCLREAADVNHATPGMIYGTSNSISFHSPLLSTYEPRLVINYELVRPSPEKSNIWPWVALGLAGAGLAGAVLTAAQRQRKERG
jgi:hypothetical protein